MLQRSIPDLATLVRTGEVRAAELTRAALDRIAKLDDELGAFLSLAGERAMEQARRIDARRDAGETLGPLAGVPLGVKDSLCTEDLPTTAGSRILDAADAASDCPRQPYRPPYDATTVARLRAADAVIVGKCNMDELAMGSSNENSAYRLARNPWDRSRTPGGSSGGSAVAVAAHMTPGALGSDAGGSVRQPAAFTGTVGVKPSYGRVSRYGLIAFASSLEQVGALATDVRGAACLLQVIAGRDDRDATSVEAPVPDYLAACDHGVDGLRIGVPEEYFAAGLDGEVETSVRTAIAGLQAEGATIEPITLPHTEYALATYYVIATAECSSNLARFDGVRYGLRKAADEDIDRLFRTSRSRGFGAEAKRRIILGTYVLSAGYYDAYYDRAQRVRTLIMRDFEAAFDKVDIIATPVSPVAAFELGSRIHDPLAMYLSDVYTLPASLAGLCALSVPCGLGGDSELPVGLQLTAPSLAEERLFATARVAEHNAPALAGELERRLSAARSTG